MTGLILTESEKIWVPILAGVYILLIVIHFFRGLLQRKLSIAGFSFIQENIDSVFWEYVSYCVLVFFYYCTSIVSFIMLSTLVPAHIWEVSEAFLENLGSTLENFPGVIRAILGLIVICATFAIPVFPLFLASLLGFLINTIFLPAPVRRTQESISSATREESTTSTTRHESPPAPIDPPTPIDPPPPIDPPTPIAPPAPIPQTLKTCMRCGAKLSAACCESCGYDHRNPVTLLKRVQPRWLQISDE